MEKQRGYSETAQDLPEQFSIIGKGAQYIVAMLTGLESCDEYTEFWVGEEPAPRVIKIPLPRDHVTLAVEDMNVNVVDQEAKIDTLVGARQKHYMETLVSTLFDRSLWQAFGRPRSVIVPDRAFPASQRTPMTIIEEGKAHLTDMFCPCFTQDYAPSLTPLIPSESGTEEGKILRPLLDQYALLQRWLVKRRLLDDIFKLDNYGYTPNGITVHDFSEFQTHKELADAAIRAKQWERITENIEYSQLTPNMQDYFNTRMEKALPPTIIDRWGTEAAERSNENYSGQLQDIVWGKCILRIISAFEATV